MKLGACEWVAYGHRCGFGAALERLAHRRRWRGPAIDRRRTIRPADGRWQVTALEVIAGVELRVVVLDDLTQASAENLASSRAWIARAAIAGPMEFPGID